MDQLFRELEDDTGNNLADFDLEELLVKEIYRAFGSLAVVFYKRAKDHKLLEDKNFNEINFDLGCHITMHMKINLFIREIFDKIEKCLDVIKTANGRRIPSAFRAKNQIKATESYEILSKILKVLPTNKQIQKSMKK